MYQVVRPSRSEFVPVRLHRYHVRLWGDASGSTKLPPLVLVHGWMDVAASYQFMVDALPEDFYKDRLIIAPDWRGFGLSTGPATDHYGFPDYLGDLECLLDHYAGDRQIDLVGHSMGGNVSMMYAGVRPERIRRLVNLEGFGMPLTKPEQAPSRYARWIDEIKALHAGQSMLKSYADANGVAARLIKTNPHLPQTKADWLARHWSEQRTQPDGSLRWEILGDAAHRITSAQLFRVDEMLELYRKITAPTLVVEADNGSLKTSWQNRYPQAEFDERIAHVPNLRRAMISNAGHMLHHDQPEALARLVVDFLGT